MSEKPKKAKLEAQQANKQDITPPPTMDAATALSFAHEWESLQHAFEGTGWLPKPEGC